MKKLKFCCAFRKDLTTFGTEEDHKKYKFCEKRYDEEGRLTGVTYFSADGSQGLVESWLYDSKGNILEESSLQPEEETDEKVTYKYDDAGNCIERADLFSGEVFNRTINTYDASNHKIHSSHVDDEGNENESESFEYDSSGLLTKHAHFDSGGESDWQVGMKYNENGKIIEEIKQDFLEKRIEKTAYSYNENEKNTGIETQNGKGQLIHKESYEHDGAGNLVTVQLQSSHPYSQNTTRNTEYDEQNRPVEVTVYDNINKYLINREETIFDENGEVTEQEIFELRAGQGMTKTHVHLRFENEYQ